MALIVESHRVIRLYEKSNERERKVHVVSLNLGRFPDKINLAYCLAFRFETCSGISPRRKFWDVCKWLKGIVEIVHS